MIKELEKHQHLPDYRVELAGDQVIFTNTVRHDKALQVRRCSLKVNGVIKLADLLGVTRQSLNSNVKDNNPTSVSPEMARRLEKCLGVSAKPWLALQAEYDLWKQRQVKPDLSDVKRLL